MTGRTKLAALAATCVAVAAGAAPAQASQFTLLDRPAAERDELPSIFDRGRTPSCDWSTARRGSSDVWLMQGTGERGPCLLATFAFGGATAAGGPKEVPPTGVSMTSSGVGHDPMIVGAVPDGIATIFFELADGTTREVAVVENTYRASYPSPIVRMSVTGPDGKVSSQPVRFGKIKAKPKRCGKKKHARKRCSRKRGRGSR